MRSFSKTVLVFLSLSVLAASPAAAREIACPHENVRTEVTTPMEDGWWQTPQVGRLQSTRVGNVGGETTLICEYSAYGTTVSVMRRPPERVNNCTAHRDGFTCVREGRRPRAEREDAAAVTYRTALLNVPQTWRADLDSGSIDSGTFDFWFHAVTATNRFLEPMNGARFGIYPGGSGISKQDCVDTPKSTNNIPVRNLSEGTYVCYRTSDGRHGVFRMNARIGRSPGTMEIGFTTWE